MNPDDYKPFWEKDKDSKDTLVSGVIGITTAAIVTSKLDEQDQFQKYEDTQINDSLDLEDNIDENTKLKTKGTPNGNLIRRIDLQKILSMPRYAGGHDDQMKGLFKNITILAHWNEGDYQGQVATAVQLNDTREVVIYSDYYGSCSGCDAWEDASDKTVIRMCIQLAAGAKIFKTIADALDFLYSERILGTDFGLNAEVRKGLLDNWGIDRVKEKNQYLTDEDEDEDEDDEDLEEDY